jgi:hypothetical protein
MSHGKLEKECTGLRAAVDMLKHENTQITIDRDVDIAVEQFFLDYRIGHRKRLHELHVGSE